MDIVLFTLLGLAGILLITLTVRLALALRRLRFTSTPALTEDLPTVTVCIPARNEAHAMTQCLERVLASDYKKLEIIVYDDSSHDDTSVLVRSFAHAGVRFVPGDSLPDGWLGKNHAHETLAREASGSLVIFMDVDTFIQSSTISQLVASVVDEQLDMISVIPRRDDGWRPSVLFGHLRYFWQVIGAGRSNPPAASALWLINRHVLLDELGGFGDYKSLVEPVTVFASKLSHRYRAVISTAQLGVSYEKRWLSQAETSRRLLYPAAGAKPVGGLLALGGLLLLNAPLFVLLLASIGSMATLQIVASVELVGFMLCYGLFVAQTRRRGKLAGALLWPLVVMQELLFLISSLLGYARHTVTWKGRQVHASGRANTLVIDK